MAKCKPFFLLFLFYIGNHSLKAQDSILLYSRWDLQSCLDYAKRNNIQLNTLRLNEQVSKQDVLLARAARYPNLYGTLGQNFTHSNDANPVISGFATQSTFASNSSVSSAWMVFNGGYINYNIKLQNLNLKQAGLSVDEIQNTLTLEITQDFLNILLAKENIIYVQDLVNTSEAQQDQGKNMYSAGSIARNALIDLEAQKRRINTIW